MAFSLALPVTSGKRSIGRLEQTSLRHARKRRRHTLEDSNGRVNTSTLLEKSSDGSSGSLRGDKDDINIGGGDDLGLKILNQNKELFVSGRRKVKIKKG